VKGRSISLCCKIEHGRIGELLHFLPYSPDYGMDIERELGDGGPDYYAHLRRSGARSRPDTVLGRIVCSAFFPDSELIR
jgi:hypothetical protein